MTRASTTKWLAGTVVFFLPTITVIVGTSCRWSYSDAFRLSIALAAIIPPALVLTSRVKWRIVFVLALLALLAVQFCFILVALLAGFRE